MGAREEERRDRLVRLRALMVSEPHLTNRQLGERLGVSEWWCVIHKPKVDALLAEPGSPEQPMESEDLARAVAESDDVEALVDHQVELRVESRLRAIRRRLIDGDVDMDEERLTRALALSPQAHARAARNMTMQAVLDLLEAHDG